VLFPFTGTRWEEWTVQGTAITDLQVIDPNATDTATPTSAVRSNAPGSVPPGANSSIPSVSDLPHAPVSQRQSSQFVDPAILSYGKSPLQTRVAPPDVQMPVEVPATPAKSMLAKAVESLPAHGSPFIAEPGILNGSREASHVQALKGTSLTRDTRDPQQTSALAGQKGVQEAPQEYGEVGMKKKVRRGQKKKAAAATPASAQSDPPTVMNTEVSRNGNDMNGNVRRGKGWRNTPLLQPSPQPASPGVTATPKKDNRRQRETNKEMQQNGWATEDATDVQDMGDFDFEASNKLFDKKGVFDQLRQDDTTADEDRLVSHNKVARPGTYGGKNLHPTENVLSPKLGPKYLSNEADSTSDADTELNLANGRSPSRHSVSRASIAKKQSSRQNSTHLDGKPQPLTTSISSDRGFNRSVTSAATRGGKRAPSIAASSPRPDRGQSPQSAISASKTAPRQTTLTAQRPAFIIQSTDAVCPVLHPTALETLEVETVSRFGLTHDAITESAARCVAEVAMTMFNDFGTSRRGSRANTMRASMTSSMLLHSAGTPVVVILAGNHSIGARAVAAARHLVCRKTKIIVAEAMHESTETQAAQMSGQTATLKRMMRAGADIKRGPWRKASNHIKNLAGPPAVIIDALLAGATYEGLLEANGPHATEARTEAREMIDWANRSRAPVLSVGCPSGVSGTDGSATVVEGEPLAVRPDQILALGAPMSGLLEAMKGGERWEVSLADVGINITLRSEEAVDFGGRWVSEVRFVDDEDGTG